MKSLYWSCVICVLIGGMHKIVLACWQLELPGMYIRTRKRGEQFYMVKEKGSFIIKKFLLPVLIIVLMMNIVVSYAYSQEKKPVENVISEIKISGLNRTGEELLKRQLPYSEGDEWREEFLLLTERRLKRLNIFDPFSLDVETVKKNSGEIEVLIHTEDRNPFMDHPMVFGSVKGINLLSCQLTQRVSNPFGNGVSFQAGHNWSTNPWWSVGFEAVEHQGRILSGNFKWFEIEGFFNNTKYGQEGYRMAISVQEQHSHDLLLSYSLIYEETDYHEGERDFADQGYIIGKGGLKWVDDGTFVFDVDYGYGASDLPDYSKLNVNWFYEEELNKEEKYHFNLRGGVASRKTPLHKQFHAGGHEEIPLRGRERNLAGTEYFTGNLEYQRELYRDLWGAIFIDGGKVVTAESDFSRADRIINVGGGLFYETPMGPLRVDIGYDIKTKDHRFGFNLGHTF